jgi:hypothetical protein
MRTISIVNANRGDGRPELKGESGIALAIVSMVLLLLTVLIVSAHFSMVSQTVSSSNYRYSMQAQYVAEAGVQRSIDWFNHRYSVPIDWNALNLPDSPRLYPAQLIISGVPSGRITLGSKSGGSFTFPVETTKTDFQNFLNDTNNIASPGMPGLHGQYDVTATLLATRSVKVFGGGLGRSERWRVESTGTIINTAHGNEIASADKVAIIETLIVSAVAHAICANTLDFNGMTDVDSYDSTIGSFGGTNQDGSASVGSYGVPCPSTDPRCYDRGRVNLIPDGQWDIPPVDQTTFGCGGSVPCGTSYCIKLPPIPNFITVSGSATGSPAGVFTAAPCVGCTSTPSPGVCPDPAGFPSSVKAGSVGNGDLITVPPNATGNYCMWVDEIIGGVTIDNRVSGAGSRVGKGALNIFINEIDYNSNNVVVKSDRENPVNIYITGDMKVGGNGTFNILPPGGSQNDQGVFVYASTTSVFDVGGNGTPSISAVIYAPNATTVLNGNIDIYGAVITDSFRKTGTSGGVHYDRDLAQSGFIVSGFIPNYQVRRIY